MLWKMTIFNDSENASIKCSILGISRVGIVIVLAMYHSKGYISSVKGIYGVIIRRNTAVTSHDGLSLQDEGGWTTSGCIHETVRGKKVTRG